MHYSIFHITNDSGSSSSYRKINGFTLIELLVTLVVASFVVLGASTLYFDSLKSSRDIRIKTEADELAKLILDMITFDVRSAASSIPNVENFYLGISELSQYPSPLAFTSDDNTLVLNVNESGKYATVTQKATPKADTTWSVYLDDTSLFGVNNLVFLSNHTTGEEYGAVGTVSAVSLDSFLKMNSGAKFVEGAEFAPGSIAIKSTTYNYNSPTTWAGITLNNGYGNVRIAEDTTFFVAYLDEDDNYLFEPGVESPTLTEELIKNTLAKIELTVYARGTTPLSDGTTYTAWAKQKIGLRALQIYRTQAWSR